MKLIFTVEATNEMDRVVPLFRPCSLEKCSIHLASLRSVSVANQMKWTNQIYSTFPLCADVWVSPGTADCSGSENKSKNRKFNYKMQHIERNGRQTAVRGHRRKGFIFSLRFFFFIFRRPQRGRGRDGKSIEKRKLKRNINFCNI